MNDVIIALVIVSFMFKLIMLLATQLAFNNGKSLPDEEVLDVLSKTRLNMFNKDILSADDAPNVKYFSRNSVLYMTYWPLNVQYNYCDKDWKSIVVFDRKLSKAIAKRHKELLTGIKKQEEIKTLECGNTEEDIL